MQWKGQQVGPIGIDLGARRVRAIQLRKRQEGHEVVAASAVETDAGAGGDEDALRSQLCKVLAEGKFVGKCAATCLPSADVRVKNLRLPDMPAAELESAAIFEAQERFRDLGDDVVIRTLRAGRVGGGGQGEGQQEMILLAASRGAIEARLKLLTDVGLTVVGLEPAAMAFFRPFERFLRRESDADRSSAFVDVGRRGSRIIVARGSDIAFLKYCPVGGQAFDEAVAKALSIPPQRAGAVRQQLFEEDAGSGAPVDSAAVMEALQPGLDQLGKELGLCLRYFAVTFRGERPEYITCGGGEVISAPLVERLSQATQIPVQVGDAFRGVEGEGAWRDSVAGTSLSEWTTALGSALRTASVGARKAQVVR